MSKLKKINRISKYDKRYDPFKEREDINYILSYGYLGNSYDNEKG